MKKLLNRTIIACSVLASIVLAIWIQDVMSDRRCELESIKQVTLLEKAPQNYPIDNRGIGVIQPGEKVKVLRMGYGKDFRAWKVRGSTGQEGWFIEEMKNVNVKN